MTRVRNIFFCLLCMASFASMYGQKVLMEERPGELYQAEKWGPNRTHYLQLTVGYSHFYNLNNNYEYSSTILNTSDFVSLQYKFKLLPILSIVSELGFAEDYFRMQVDKPSPIDGLAYNSELLKTQGAQFALGFRFNPDIRRGNIIGTFIQVSLQGEQLMASRRVMVVEGQKERDGFSKQKVIQSNLDYLNPFQYGLEIAVGINKIGLFYNHQITNWINQNKISLQLPRQKIGFRYSLLN